MIYTEPATYECQLLLWSISKIYKYILEYITDCIYSAAIYDFHISGSLIDM